MAITADRNTAIKRRGRTIVAKMAVVKLYAGQLICANASGFAAPAADTANFIILGRAEETVDNTGGSAGDKSIRVTKGVFKWANAASTPAVVQGDIGRTAYVSDDQTVARTGGSNNVVAGVIDEIDADGGIWVATL